MLTANIEGDELIMQTVTSLSNRDYVIKFRSGATLKNNRRRDKRGLHKLLARMGKVEGVDYELVQDITYKDYLAETLIIKKLKKIYAMTRCDFAQIWLGPSNKSNFRFSSAKTKEYKSNREAKPELAKYLKEYLIAVHGAKVIEGYEADDALGIYQHEGSIAVHCDKDIFMIPGRHFCTIRDIQLRVEDPGDLELIKGKLKGTGLAFFYAQMLLGDPTDSIPNLVSGMGPVKVFNLLKDCSKEIDYLSKVVETYAHVLGGEFLERLLEQADLVWICRDLDETGKDYIQRKMKELM